MTGTPAPARSRTSSSSPSARRPAHRLGECADARHDEPVGRAQRVVVAGEHRRGARPARAPSRPTGGCPCRSRRSRSQSACPSSTARPSRSGRSPTAARSARANALKAASIMWCAFVPASTVTCSVSCASLGDGAEELLGQLVVERRRSPRAAGRPRRRRTGGRRCRARSSRAPRPSARRRGRSGRSRRGRRAPGRAPGRARCRCPRPCGGRRSRRSPVTATSRSSAAVAGQQVEHVVEEADAGGARPGAASRRGRARAGRRSPWCARAISAVRVMGGRHSAGLPSSARGARIPRPARSGAPAFASAPAASPMCTCVMRRRKWRTDSAEPNRAEPPVGSVWFEPAT